MTGAPRPGTLVVVGGHSRGVGKTSVLKAILRATPGMNWHVLKISSHAHHARHDERQANLVHLADEDIPDGAARLAAMLADGRNLLVESNRIVPHLIPDVLIFVVNPLNPDWKASSASCLTQADALVFSQDGPCPVPLQKLRSLLPAFRLTSWNQPPLGLVEWLSERLPAVEVTLHETPLAGSPAHSSVFSRGANCRGAQAHQMGQDPGARLDSFPG